MTVDAMHAGGANETHTNPRHTDGTAHAKFVGMAAIFALVFVPGLAAVLFMVGAVSGGLSIATISAAVVFSALAAGVFAGLLRLTHQWEDEQPTGT